MFYQNHKLHRSNSHNSVHNFTLNAHTTCHNLLYIKWRIGDSNPWPFECHSICNRLIVFWFSFNCFILFRFKVKAGSVTCSLSWPVLECLLDNYLTPPPPKTANHHHQCILVLHRGAWFWVFIMLDMDNFVCGV